MQQKESDQNFSHNILDDNENKKKESKKKLSYLEKQLRS